MEGCKTLKKIGTFFRFLTLKKDGDILNQNPT